MFFSMSNDTSPDAGCFHRAPISIYAFGFPSSINSTDNYENTLSIQYMKKPPRQNMDFTLTRKVLLSYIYLFVNSGNE